MSWRPICRKAWSECSCESIYTDREGNQFTFRNTCPQCGRPVDQCRCADRCRYCQGPPGECDCLVDWANQDYAIKHIGGGGRLVIKNVRPIPGYNPARFAVAIEIGDKTNSKQVNAAIDDAFRWRDGLIRRQGTWFHRNIDEFFDTLDELQRGRESYGSLARRLSQTIEVCMRLFLDVDHRANVELLLIGDPPGHHLDWLTRAEVLLRTFLSIEEADQFRDVGLQNLESGRAPFPTEQPILSEQVRARLRYYREKNTKGPTPPEPGSQG